jgi:predicted ArsR family transcriptional regulator
MSSHQPQGSWTFVTNHTQVLLCVTRDPDVTLREVGRSVGITERAVQRIVSDLVEAGFLERERVGRRNRYVVNREMAMRHPAQFGLEIGPLLELLESNGAHSTGRTGTPGPS